MAVDSLAVVAVAGSVLGIGIGTASASGAELIMSSAPPERAGSASGVNETLVEAAGALGIAVLGSVLVETGSFGWPLPVAAGVAAIVAVGVARRRLRATASQPSIAGRADALSASGAPEASIDARAMVGERVVVEPQVVPRKLVLLEQAGSEQERVVGIEAAG